MQGAWSDKNPDTRAVLTISSSWMLLHELIARARKKTTEPGHVTASFVRLVRACAPLIRLVYRPVFEGTEHLPASGPYLLVSNHSGGIAAAECTCLALMYVEKLGTERRLASFAHPVGFHVWPASTVLRAVGAIPSTHEDGERTLAQGVPILIFPGGDHDALRPVWQASRVDFNGRTGFLKLARKMNVPIVPMGISGSHFTAPILWRSDYVLARLLVVPRLLGIKRYPLTVVALAGALAIACFAPWAWPWRVLAIWIWMLLPFPTMLPWIPWTVRIRVGTPLAPEVLFPDGNDVTLETALARVESEVRALVRGK